MTIFQLLTSSVSTSHAVVAFDPHAISLSSAEVESYHSPSSDAVKWNQSRISTVALLPAPHKCRVFDDVSTSGPDTSDTTEGISFYKLFMLRSDLSVRECVYVGETGKVNDGFRMFALNRLNRTRSQKSAAITMDDQMVIPGKAEAFVTDQGEKMILEGKHLARQHKHTPIRPSDHSPVDDWTVNSEFLYGLVTGITRSKALTMSPLALDEQDRQLSSELMREMIDRKRKGGGLGIESL